jgi:hypothetical protein
LLQLYFQQDLLLSEGPEKDPHGRGASWVFDALIHRLDAGGAASFEMWLGLPLPALLESQIRVQLFRLCQQRFLENFRNLSEEIWNDYLALLASTTPPNRVSPVSFDHRILKAA